MITTKELKEFNSIPISRTTKYNIEIIVPVEVIYKVYKPGDIIIGDLITDDWVFVMLNDRICWIQNSDILLKNVTKIIVSAKIQRTKHTNDGS